MGRKRIGLFKTKRAALNDAAARRRQSDNDLNPFNTYFYRVERSKNPKNPKKPSYAVIQTSRKKSPAARKRARAKFDADVKKSLRRKYK